MKITEEMINAGVAVLSGGVVLEVEDYIEAREAAEKILKAAVEQAPEEAQEEQELSTDPLSDSVAFWPLVCLHCDGYDIPTQLTYVVRSVGTERAIATHFTITEDGNLDFDELPKLINLSSMENISIIGGMEALEEYVNNLPSHDDCGESPVLP